MDAHKLESPSNFQNPSVASVDDIRTFSNCCPFSPLLYREGSNLDSVGQESCS